jgi:hypothetical protein
MLGTLPSRRTCAPGSTAKALCLLAQSSHKALDHRRISSHYMMRYMQDAARMAGRRVTNRVGVFSRKSALRQVDGRTREAKVIEATIRELTEHCGGEARVSAPQRLLIHSTAILVLRLRSALDRYATGDDPESLDRHVCALQNSMRQNLALLGLQRAEAEAPTLHRYLELKARAA